MRFADSERSMARGMARDKARIQRRQVGGQDRSSLKRVSCGVGEEDCHVASSMKCHMGAYERPRGRLGGNLFMSQRGDCLEGEIMYARELP